MYLTYCVSLLYLIIHMPLQLYLVQFMLGTFSVFIFFTYRAIFTRYFDKDKEEAEWGVYFILIDLTSAGFATIGGFIAALYGFHVLIGVVVVLSIHTSLICVFVLCGLGCKQLRCDCVKCD